MRILLIPVFTALALMAGEPSALVQTIVESSDFHQRLEAVHRLPERLSQADLHALYAMLERPDGTLGEAALENDLLNALRRTGDTRLGGVLINMAANPRQNPVVRDYALQHLGLWYPQSERQEEVRALLWQATQQTGDSMAGTALLALLRQAPNDPEIQMDELGRRAMAIASDRNSGELSRITALRICGRLNHSEALQPAMDIMGEASSISMKLAAIATIGDLGNVRHAELLQAMKYHKRLALAAEKALEKLEKKGTRAGS